MTRWPGLVLFFHCSGLCVYPDSDGIWTYPPPSPAPVLSISLKAQTGYYSHFLFSLFFSNGAIKICIHLMSPILSKFFHGSLSPCVKRPLAGLECCKALLTPSALRPRCSSLSPLSLFSCLLVVTPTLCVSQPLARLCTVQLWSLKFILSRVSPRHSSIHADTGRLCCSCCGFRGTDVSVDQLWTLACAEGVG